MPCSGNTTEICGDGNALSVRVNGKSPLLTAVANPNNTTGSFNAKVDLNQKFSSWKTWKARGTNLGNWLVLERWMDPTWFDQASGNVGAVDEWTFCQALGTAGCTSQLQQHWASWVTQSDISQLASAGLNTLRIPVGFWAFIDPIAGEPYVRSTQLQELSRVLGYARASGMTVTLDLHGLPGSQNGADHSGHIGEIAWYTSANQQRSLQTVQAAATWLAGSGFAGTVTAFEVANEPAIANWDQWLMYKDFVLASHAILQKTVPGVATMFHDGFWALEPWNQFFTAADNVVLDTHRYFAFAQTTLEQAVSDVCAYVADFQKMNMPVFVGEFSLSIQTTAADSAAAAQNALAFFETQMQAWTQAAGGAMWSLKAMNADGSQNLGWSTSGLIQSGLFGGLSVWDLAGAQCAAPAA
ncbi:glycoside hydrolase superfamily [Protomyces lactucae-debilis]|uniref:glucan 1,3-beta-glucosidase n=1 Tax=Protomyces lactucae-debilis TaxID=2754530 RepID=A0A1Y2F9B2_PROLT|nr:glycoside hydrolase superfamily [Protomyces lactucae-debilis]ORY80463.1 glycoside hydrolase superfamily [Protomyces lactucae-debilis]